MKKSLSMMALTALIVLITGTFSYAEYAAAGPDNFPYFHLGAMVIGGSRYSRSSRSTRSSM
jgi:hypothetical protein